MFTVKQISAEHGGETLWEAKGEVTYTPTVNFAGSLMAKRVSFTTMDGIIATIDSGVVYVMNAVGKTVGVYDFNRDESAVRLDRPPPPALAA